MGEVTGEKADSTSGSDADLTTTKVASPSVSPTIELVGAGGIEDGSYSSRDRFGDIGS
jgi:hypothetical protein